MEHMEQIYTDKSFCKLTLNNRILRANDKLAPASLQNWRKIFAGNGESYINKDGKTVKLNALIGIELVEYDKQKQAGQKTGKSIEYNLTPANINMIVKNIDRSLATDGVLFADMKTHAYKLNSDGKGEVIFFEIKKESTMSNGAKSKYPYAINIKKGWAFLREEGVGYDRNSFQNDFYLTVRLSYADICYFFESIKDGIEVFKLTEGCRLRREGIKYEFEQLKSKN